MRKICIFFLLFCLWIISINGHEEMMPIACVLGSVPDVFPTQEIASESENRVPEQTETRLYSQELPTEPEQKKLGLQNVFDVYPCEIALGDTIYWGCMLENQNANTLWMSGKNQDAVRWNWDIYSADLFTKYSFQKGGLSPYSITCTREDLSSAPWEETFYQQLMEVRPQHDSGEFGFLSKGIPNFMLEYPIRGGEKLLLIGDSLEFPPLEDWEHPFWKRIRKETASGKQVEISLNLAFYGTRLLSFTAQSVSIPIRIKPRPEAEMQEIQRWYDETPEELFPEVIENVKVWGQDFQIQNGKNLPVFKDGKTAMEKMEGGNILIQKNSVPAYFFMPAGCRKPSGQGIPKNSAGWKALEERFSAGTMRDEIRMTRYLLDIFEHPGYAVELGIPHIEASAAEMDRWMETLPDVQRLVMLGKIRTRFHEIYMEVDLEKSQIGRTARALWIRYLEFNLWRWYSETTLWDHWFLQNQLDKKTLQNCHRILIRKHNSRRAQETEASESLETEEK